MYGRKNFQKCLSTFRVSNLSYVAIGFCFLGLFVCFVYTEPKISFGDPGGIDKVVCGVNIFTIQDTPRAGFICYEIIYNSLWQFTVKIQEIKDSCKDFFDSFMAVIQIGALQPSALLGA